MGSYLALCCNGQPIRLCAPDQLPPIYRILDKGRETITYIVLNGLQSEDVDVCIKQGARRLLLPQVFQVEL